MNKVTSTYQVDSTMQGAIERLRVRLALAINSDVIRHSIALMLLAIQSADGEKTIYLLNRKLNVLQRIPLKA